MKKVIILVMIAILTLTGCSKKNENTSTTSNTVGKTTYEISNFASKIEADEVIDSKIIIKNNTNTPENMLENSDLVALVSVISLDSSDMNLNKNVGHTYGKMLVQKVYKGDKMNGDVVDFAKLGAMMISREDYESALSEEKLVEIENKRKEKGFDYSRKIYYNLSTTNDATIEVGKTYLAYFKHLPKLDKYEIIGLDQGLREVNIPFNKKISLIEINNELDLKNNANGEWESLDEYLNNYLK